MALPLFLYNSLPGRVCSFTYSERAKESFHPEKEHRLVLQLKRQGSSCLHLGVHGDLEKLAGLGVHLT